MTYRSDKLKSNSKFQIDQLRISENDSRGKEEQFLNSIANAKNVVQTALKLLT